MKLSIKERFLLLGMLPENSGSLAERRLIRNLKSKLVLSKSEADDIEYEEKQVQGVDGIPRIMSKWNRDKEIGIIIEETEEMKALLKEIVKQVEAERMVNDDNFELLEKIEMI